MVIYKIKLSTSFQRCQQDKKLLLINWNFSSKTLKLSIQADLKSADVERKF